MVEDHRMTEDRTDEETQGLAGQSEEDVRLQDDGGGGGGLQVNLSRQVGLVSKSTLID